VNVRSRTPIHLEDFILGSHVVAMSFALTSNHTLSSNWAEAVTAMKKTTSETHTAIQAIFFIGKTPIWILG
jgi:hypothetical protein